MSSGRSLIVGRDPTCDVIFPVNDTRVSRRHARFVPIGGGRWEVQDLGSANGVFVNGRRVEVAHVGPADQVSLGSAPFALARLQPAGGPVQHRVAAPAAPQLAPTPVMVQPTAPAQLSFKQRETLGHMRVLTGIGLLFVVAGMFLPWWDFSQGRNERLLFLPMMLEASQSLQHSAPVRSMLLAQWYLIPMTALGSGLPLLLRKDPLLLVAASAPVAVAVHVVSLWTHPPLLRSMRFSRLVDLDSVSGTIGAALSHMGAGVWVTVAGILMIAVATELSVRLSGRGTAYGRAPATPGAFG